MPSASLGRLVGRENGGSGGGGDGGGDRFDAPLTGARVDGGLRGPPCASRAARVRRCERFRSIPEAWVMNATTRMGLWQVGHASGSTSKICCRRAAHQRVTSVGASRGAGDDQGWRIGCCGLGLTPHSARKVGVPTVVPRGDVALVRNVHEDAGEELERVGGFGPRRRAL